MAEQRVGKNKVVTFTYLIMDETGQVQEQSDIPMSYLHGGDDRIFPAVMQAMEGREVGETVEIVLPPKEGFGEYDPTLTYRDRIENVPPEFRRIGAEAEFRNDAGESVTMTVVKMENGEIMLDGNHPFAGKTMTFKVNITAIRDAAEEEVRTGKVVTDGPDLGTTTH
ncbi:MAG TPA: peptidylprolyl isomerase [Gammaproteobacteria bacterium]|nr:peptidylprolyl isomerase [Gammaproteobacteria bacterium]